MDKSSLVDFWQLQFTRLRYHPAPNPDAVIAMTVQP
jgi:hypothetical protein